MRENFENWSEDNSTEEGEYLKALRNLTMRQGTGSQMISSILQGRFLSFISKLVNPKKVLEIGTFTGMSALCIAEGLQKGGVLYTIDQDKRSNNIARQAFDKSKYHNNIYMLFGKAIDIIPNLDETFDLVFIDADKNNYLNYYKICINKLRKGGLIIIDNVWWKGRVMDERYINEDPRTISIISMVKYINDDTSVDNIILPIRDGLILVMKK